MRTDNAAIGATRLLRATGAGALVAILVLLTPMAALAADADYGWGDCNWAYKETGSRQITWNYHSSYPLPANGMGDGVLNSFTNRVTDAVARWNAVLGLSTPNRLVKVTGAGPNIWIKYSAPPGAPTPFGATVVYSTFGPCTLHSSANNQMSGADIYIVPQGVWFTQDDSRRGLWENCFFDPSAPAYTCSKLYDFGSTFTHELGHAMGIFWHPVDVGPVAQTLADCTKYDGYDRPIWRHTLCNARTLDESRWRSERRTLEAWDRESLRLLYVYH